MIFNDDEIEQNVPQNGNLFPQILIIQKYGNVCQRLVYHQRLEREIGSSM